MSIGWAQTFGVDLDQVARALGLYVEDPSTSLQSLGRELGIGVPKVESLNAWLKFLGLRDPKSRGITPLGDLLHRLDPTLTNTGTLCALHYVLVSNPAAEVWYEVVNLYLAQRPSFTRQGLVDYFKSKGIGQSSPKQLSTDIGLLIRTYTDANRRSFQALGYLQEQGDIIVARAVSLVPPLIIGYCLFHRLENRTRESTTSITRLLHEEGALGPVFRLNADELRQKLASLESGGYITVVHSAGLDGVSYSPQASSLGVLEAHLRVSDDPTPLTPR